MTRVPTALSAIALAAALGACGGDSGSSGANTPDDVGSTPLVGLFRIDAGGCEGGTPTGSHFRMLQPNGTPAAGPFVVNGDSSCADKTTTPLTPGTEGGLRTGAFQPQSATPFDGGGNGVAAAVIAPQKWFAVTFALASNQTDPQTGKATVEPRIELDGTSLTGDLSALAAAWNGQHFNQGAPKPGGELPGRTTKPTGTFNPETKEYQLDWSSQIVGGPFNSFTGVWHLEGTFEPA